MNFQFGWQVSQHQTPPLGVCHFLIQPQPHPNPSQSSAKFGWTFFKDTVWGTILQATEQLITVRVLMKSLQNWCMFSVKIICFIQFPCSRSKYGLDQATCFIEYSGLWKEKTTFFNIRLHWELANKTTLKQERFSHPFSLGNNIKGNKK